MTPPQPLSPPSEQPPSPAYPGRLGAWLAFTRPKTWLLAVAPVLAALALAWAEAHAFSPVVALLTLTIAVLMQAISNMENDLGYSKRAIDEDFLELQPWGGLATMQPNGQFEWRQFLH